MIDTTDILEYLCNFIKYNNSYKNKDNKELITTDENVLNFRKSMLTKILNILDLNVLPHVGMTKNDRIKKAKYLGYMIRRLLLVNLQVLPSADRDSYINKRMRSSGEMYSRGFKTQFNFFVVQKLKRAYADEFSKQSFKNISLQGTFSKAFKPEDFEKALINMITTGDKTMVISQMVTQNRLSSQQMHPKNQLNILVALKNIDTPNSDSNTSNDRAIVLRQFHPTGIGYVCGVTSHDTGAKIGMSKQMTISCNISYPSSLEVIKNIILDDPDLIKDNNKFNDRTRLTKENLHLVFVNGELLGFVSNYNEFLYKYRNYRRIGKLHHLTGICNDLRSNTINFWVDSGRLYRPLIIVYNNIRNNKEKFKQWINVTMSLLQDVESGKLTIMNLIEQGIVEFITPEEQSNCYIAYELDHFNKYINNNKYQFTHVDIPQALMSIVALTSVFANFNQSTRVCFQTNQVKQAIAWALKNWAYTAHKDLYMQISNEQPLVNTLAYKYIPPMGLNSIVAINMYGGYNQDDSLVINKASVERGMFDAIHLTFQKTECEENEIICKPDPTTTTDLKSFANYDKLVDGIVPIGTFIQENDVIIGKVAKLLKSDITDPTRIYTDRSLVYKVKEPVYVHNIICDRNNEEKRFIKIIFKSFRSVELGGKFSSRAGQKGICGFIYEESDMPFLENGMHPDIIFNPLSLPSRMTMGVIYEGMMAKICAHKGANIDATMFRKFDINNISKTLKELGYEDNGVERLYNGMTGNYIDCKIFIAPIYYQCLQKYCIDVVYSQGKSPTDVQTRLPLHGKKVQGGVRLGSMETSVLSTNSINTLQERITDHADKFQIYICRTCNNKGVVNDEFDIYKCNYCGNNAQLEQVSSTWTSNLFIGEINSMNIGTKFHLKPQSYDEFL